MVRKLSASNSWWLILIVVLGCLYFLFDPMQSRWMPQCIFHKITGLQCMGCGAQRMIHHLLHGEIDEAMMANLFLFFSLPFIIFLVWLELSRKKHPRLYARIHSLPVIVSCGTLPVAWLIIRNLLAI